MWRITTVPLHGPYGAPEDTAMLRLVEPTPRVVRATGHEVAMAGWIEPLFRLETCLWTMWPALMWYATLLN